MTKKVCVNLLGHHWHIRASRGVFAVLGLCAMVVFIASCASISRTQIIPPTIPGAKFVGMDACADCHEKTVKNFARSSHARVNAKSGKLAGMSGCESCHGPASLHVDADDKDKKATIVNPGKSAAQCFRCHFDKEIEFHLPYTHPVLQGKITCSDCHDPHGSDARKPKGLAIARINDTCMECHREQARTHVYEHEALREGCVTCHNAHGSINKKMLTETDNNLCLKCHAQISPKGVIDIGTRDHSSNLSNSRCWSAGCHTGVHGSNIDSHLRY